MKWISIADDLPNDGENVDVWANPKNHIEGRYTQATYMEKHKTFSGGQDRCNWRWGLEAVTHWIRIDPPQDDIEE